MPFCFVKQWHFVLLTLPQQQRLHYLPRLLPIPPTQHATPRPEPRTIRRVYLWYTALHRRDFIITPQHKRAGLLTTNPLCDGPYPIPSHCTRPCCGRAIEGICASHTHASTTRPAQIGARPRPRRPWTTGPPSCFTQPSEVVQGRRVRRCSPLSAPRRRAGCGGRRR